MKTRIITLALIVITLTSCNSTKKSSSDVGKNSNKEMTINNTITEKYWKLKTLEGHEIKTKKNQEHEIYFMLKTAENRVTGFAGCNTITGKYTLEEGNRIRFSYMATTLKICPDVDINESEVLEVFNLADNYTINNDTLSLNVGRRAPLAVFEAVYFK